MLCIDLRYFMNTYDIMNAKVTVFYFVKTDFIYDVDTFYKVDINYTIKKNLFHFISVANTLTLEVLMCEKF